MGPSKILDPMTQVMENGRQAGDSDNSANEMTYISEYIMRRKSRQSRDTLAGGGVNVARAGSSGLWRGGRGGKCVDRQEEERKEEGGEENDMEGREVGERRGEGGGLMEEGDGRGVVGGEMTGEGMRVKVEKKQSTNQELTYDCVGGVNGVVKEEVGNNLLKECMSQDMYGDVEVDG